VDASRNCFLTKGHKKFWLSLIGNQNKLVETTYSATLGLTPVDEVENAKEN